MKKFLIIFFSCLLALSVLTTGAIWLYNRQTKPSSPSTQSPFAYQLTVSLNGEQDTKIEYGEVYREPGATAQLIGGYGALDVPVEIQGEVDSAKIGTYIVTYTAKSTGFTATATRKIHIVDTQLPKITLTVDPYAYTIPGQPYKEEGFRATDNYDGDITDRVTCVEENGVITYTVTDSSGNTFSTKRTIHYFDPGRPNLKLTGSNIHLVAQGDHFVDPWVTAVDKNDGDITNSVYVEGHVDSSVPGRYTLQYIATNSHNCANSITRTVIVLPMDCLIKETEPPQTPTSPTATKAPIAPTKPTETEIPTEPTYPKNCMIPEGGMPYEENGKTIYLTFDDGPSQHTKKLLDVLAVYDVKVSFFVKNSSYMDIITRAAQEGHTVAAHTYTHDYNKIYTSEDAFYKDMSAIRTTIAMYTQNATSLLRFPGGSSNTISMLYNRGIMTRLAKALTEMGYTYFDWNVDSNDAGGAKTPDEVFKNITKGVQNRDASVVLQHDTKEFSVDAVERVIAWALVNGYRFEPLTEDSPTFHHPINN
ncbi:MAG: DUF5011 domain-containing protein [Oscillospiraceae bacterium]|nr:DUF5011 domain-containing protein [Oscillospiraceae bacterium]